MSKSRRHPISPYLLRRLRSYEEAYADRQGTRDEGLSYPQRTRRPHDVEAESTGE